MYFYHKRDKKDELGSDRPGRPTLVPEETMEQALMEAISRYMKGKKVTGNSQYGFTKGKSHLTNLTAFYDDTICSADEALWLSRP